MSPANNIFSSYFRIGNPGALTVFVKASVPGGTSMLKITINGTPFNVTAAGTANTTYTVGTVPVVISSGWTLPVVFLAVNFIYRMAVFFANHVTPNQPFTITASGTAPTVNLTTLP